MSAVMHGIDIFENYLLSLGQGVLDSLLIDRTTGENIIWATDGYAHFGEAYAFHRPIKPELITGKHSDIIQPRAVKARKEQIDRTKNMAEVFTPSWVCNAMINALDRKWFGREDVFNVERPDEQTWMPTTEKVTFPTGKTWQDYVSINYLEFTCGEAPFLASRYDTVTGAVIPVERRIGVLDRKLRIVGENVTTEEEWLLWVQKAFKATYGYEWQGDNLLLARESLLVTFADYYEARFKAEPPIKDLAFIAYILSWNIWQMDGLKCVIPRSCHDEHIVKNSLFESMEETRACQGCEKGDYHKHNGVYSLIRNWTPTDNLYSGEGEVVRFIDTKD